MRNEIYFPLFPQHFNKIQIKSEKLIPVGGIFSIMEQFNSMFSSAIDSTLGLKYKSFGYQYSEIIRSLMSVYFCGGSCVKTIYHTHLIPAKTTNSIQLRFEIDESF